jgi:hypothetical protein
MGLGQRRAILGAAFRPNFAAVDWSFAVRASCGVAAAIMPAQASDLPTTGSQSPAS